MQIFLASDMIDTLRFRPALREALEEEELREPDLPAPALRARRRVARRRPSWPTRSNALRTGTGAPDGDAAPGLHGNGLAAVTLGGTTLTPGASAPRSSSASDLAFEIQVQNQGENTETDVNVDGHRSARATTRSSSRSRSTRSPPARSRPVTIPLAEQPPTGQNVPITVEVEAVPGEEKTDNNIQEFSVIFTR